MDAIRVYRTLRARYTNVVGNAPGQIGQMRLIRKLLLILGTVVILSIIYIAAVMDNVYLTVTNYSSPVKMQVWVEKPEFDKSSEYIINDSIQSAKSTNDERTYSVRRNTDTEYLIIVKLDNEEKVYKETIQMKRFQFVYITIDDETGDSRVVINAYDLKEAWDMNLIFGQEG